MLAFTAVGRLLLGLRFPVAPFVLIALGIGLYNAYFLFLSRRGPRDRRGAARFAGLQVVADLLALTALMHFGGGIENPFISYYLFHTIIAAVLLPWRSVMLQVVFASACMVGLAFAELSGLLPHRHIEGLLAVEHYDDWKFVMITLAAFVTTLGVAALLAASLSERLHEREKELERANAELAEQDRVRSQYVMRVAHDVAEPAGMVTSCLKVVTQGLAGNIPEKALDMVRRAEQKSEYLGHLVRDLLSLSRIKAAKKLVKAPVDLAETVEQVIEELHPRAAAKNLEVVSELPDGLPPVYGNPEALHELFNNLVTNAVKYTPVGGRVAVAAANGGEKITVHVQDNGVGIPPDALPHIFEEFYRADNVRTEATGGTGLGLCIVSQILKAHDGTIRVESQEGKGTTFSFTLPVAREAYA